MQLTQHISQFFATNNIPSGQRILVAVSGGIDSMVLVHALHALAQPIHVAHVHHGKRKASDEEASFVGTWCTTRNIGYSQKNLNPANMPAGANFHDWARTARYTFFAETAEENNCAYIATAHHFNDKIETFLAHALRGSGITGLTSLHTVTGQIIRPLLDVPQHEVYAYAQSNNVAWREDESNASSAYQRNRIRQQLVPALKAVNPAYEAGVRLTLAHLHDEQLLLNAFVNQWKAAHVRTHQSHMAIAIKGIREAPAPAALLFHALHNIDPGFNWQALAACPGAAIGSFYLGKTHRALRDRTVLRIEKITSVARVHVQIDAETTQVTRPMLLRIERVQPDEATQPHQGMANSTIAFTKHDALLDFSKLQFPLLIRNVQKGDRFRPLGMQGFKKISDYLTDAKVPRSEKEHTLVLTSKNEIVWVIGHQIDDRYKVGADTQMMYLVRPQK